MIFELWILSFGAIGWWIADLVIELKNRKKIKMARPVSKPPSIGTVFTYLTVTGNHRTIIKNGINVAHIDVKCSCGNELTVPVSNLKTGKKKSCGCLPKEMLLNRITTMSGLSRTKEYRAWAGMIKRCYNPKYSLYNRYGGRGIKVCDRWLNSLSNFIEDMGLCPIDKNSIDRYPNNDGDYEPGNCRWATNFEQCNNRSSNKLFTIKGETRSLQEWCNFFNLNYKRIWSRIYQCNWDILKALTTPLIDSKYKKGHK